MKVHTLLETIFDLSKGDVPKEWERIFQYHAAVHAAWLRDHQNLHEPRYVALVLRTATA